MKGCLRCGGISSRALPESPQGRPSGPRSSPAPPSTSWLCVPRKVTLKEVFPLSVPPLLPNILPTDHLSFLQSGGASSCPLTEQPVAEASCPQVSGHTPDGPVQPLENACIPFQIPQLNRSLWMPWQNPLVSPL